MWQGNSSLVGQETVRIAFLVAALNDLNVLARDMQNAFLNSLTKEKISFRAGNEWKADEEKTIVITRALYGLKSSALMWQNHLAEITRNNLEFKFSLADQDL